MALVAQSISSLICPIKRLANEIEPAPRTIVGRYHSLHHSEKLLRTPRFFRSYFLNRNFNGPEAILKTIKSFFVLLHKVAREIIVS